MSTTFEPREGLIAIPVRVFGPTGDTVARLALDTGATRSVLSPAVLVSIGYDPAVSTERVHVTTGSSVEYLAGITLTRLEGLDCERADFPVLCHTLPPSAGVDGLLGLDFLRGQRLTIDFRGARVELE
jgi:predicted aspartyl protease